MKSFYWILVVLMKLLDFRNKHIFPPKKNALVIKESRDVAAVPPRCSLAVGVVDVVPRAV